MTKIVIYLNYTYKRGVFLRKIGRNIILNLHLHKIINQTVRLIQCRLFKIRQANLF